MTIMFSPYLGFGGEARAALEYYQSIFGGEIRIYTYDEFGGPPPERRGDDVMHGEFTSAIGFRLNAADDPAVAAGAGGVGTASLAVFGDEAADGEQLEAWFAALSEGGEVVVPLEPQVWGDTYGVVKDRFGVVWSLDYGTGDAQES